MRRPRFVLGLRALMLKVLAIGLLLGLIADWVAQGRRRADLASQVSRQIEVTEKILKAAAAEVHVHAASLKVAGIHFGWKDSAGSASGPDHWNKQFQIHCEIGRELSSLVDLDLCEVPGDLRLRPIVLADRGGEFNAKILKRLCQAYRENGWRFRVVTNKVAPTTSN